MQAGPVMKRSVGNDRPRRLDDMRRRVKLDTQRATTDAVFSLTRPIGRARARSMRPAPPDCNVHDRTHIRAQSGTKHATSSR